MKRVAWLAVCVLFAGPVEGDDALSGGRVRESTFVRGGAEYRIRAEKFAASTFCCPAIRIAYRVWRDGKFLHPEDPNGGRQVSPVRQSELTSSLDLEPFPDADAPVGWSIRCGYGCMNTTNELAIVILPEGNAYREVVWHWMDGYWTVVRSGESVEVWTLMRDEGHAGTWGNVFIPERRVLSKYGSSLDRKALDPDRNQWPEPYRNMGFPCLFVAGLREENPALMRSALSLWQPGFEPWCQEFGLPREFTGCSQLVDAMDEAVTAKARLRALCPLVH